MKILIAGAGKVGRTLCEELSDEGHEITVIDNTPKVLEDVVSKYDVITVNGNSASKATLEEAGIQNAEVFVAATNMDEVNLLSCITAQALNPNLATVARIRNPEYIDQANEMRDTSQLPEPAEGTYRAFSHDAPAGGCAGILSQVQALCDGRQGL